MGNARSEAQAGAQRTAHEYLRVSVDGSGIEESQAEQHEDNERVRRDEGWRRGRTYKDTGSASRYARKTRDDFGKLINDLRSGVIRSGEVLQLWESSRGSREQAEWATFLNLLRDNNVLLHVTSHRRLYDLHNPRDRRTLDEDGVDSAYESAKTSMRITRHIAANAAKGRPHGRVPFGYRRIYDPDTGRLVSQVPKEGEAEIVRELFARLAQRHSLHSIAKDFATRGIVNDSGTPFSAQHLRILATNPTYAGLRVHDTGRHGRAPRPGPGTTTVTATVTEGQWEPLVDRRRFHVVQQFLSAPGRRTNGARPGRAVHAFSMILRCGVCAGPLVVRNSREKGVAVAEYFCQKKSCVRANKAELDGFATDAVLAALQSPQLYAALTPADGEHEAELAAVRDRLADLRARHDELAHSVVSGALSPLFAAKAEPEILAAIAEAEKREQELLTPGVLTSLIAPGADVAQRWHDAQTSTKREVARLLFSPDVLGELRLLRSPVRGHRGPVEQRIQWWKPRNSTQ
jgi:site-specific DNA recombinase